LRANPDRRDLVGFRVYCIHGGYYGEIWIREIKLLALDIENTGDRPIGLSSIKQKTIQPQSLYKVRTVETNREGLSVSSLEEYPLPIESLNPKEHLIIPLQIEFGYADQMQAHANWNFERYLVAGILPKKWWANRKDPQIAFQILRSTDRVGNPQFDIRHIARSMLEEKPDFASLVVPTYLVGQSIDIKQIVFKTGNGTLTPKEVRRFDPNNLLAKGAYDAGSCPILSWKIANDQEWSRVGPVLIDGVTSEREMTQSIAIRNGATVFRLSEEEDETTFLESVSLKVFDAAGQAHTFYPVTHELQNRIGRFYRLESGSTLELRFDIPDSMKLEHERTLVIRGYYVPNSLISH
jgi:hypothetical protein